MHLGKFSRLLGIIGLGVLIGVATMGTVKAQANTFPASFRHTWYSYTDDGYTTVKFTKTTFKLDDNPTLHLSSTEGIVMKRPGSSYYALGYQHSESIMDLKVTTHYINGKKHRSLVARVANLGNKSTPYSYQYFYRSKIAPQVYMGFPAKYRGTWKRHNDKLKITATTAKGGPFGQGLSSKRDGLVSYYYGKSLVVNLWQHNRFVADGVLLTVSGHKLTVHVAGSTMTYKK